MTITELRELTRIKQNSINQYVKDYSGVDSFGYNLYSGYAVVGIDDFEANYFFRGEDIADLELKANCTIDTSPDELTYEEYVEMKNRPKTALKALRRALIAYRYIVAKES